MTTAQVNLSDIETRAARKRKLLGISRSSMPALNLDLVLLFKNFKTFIIKSPTCSAPRPTSTCSTTGPELRPTPGP